MLAYVEGAAMRAAHFIFYVADQRRSADFYRKALGAEPRLDVPGMTEFDLVGGAVLGLMPEAGITRLLGGAVPDPASARGAPRAELYLVGPDARARFDRAVSAGARASESPDPERLGPHGRLLPRPRRSRPRLRRAPVTAIPCPHPGGGLYP